jgi:hypothetical protein
MHYMTNRSPRIQKHKFIITCPGVLLMGPAPGPPENEKYCVDVSHPGRTKTRYVTSRSYMMPKQKFVITGPGALLVGPTSAPPEHKKLCFSILHN